MNVYDRAFRLTILIAALAAGLVMAAPAWASTVQVQDDAHVLNVTAVQNDAATLPVAVYIWATTQDADNKSTFDTDVRNKVSAEFPIVIGINTQSRHESIQIGSRAGLSRDAALTVGSNANRAFLTTIRSNHDYTAAVTAALDNLRTGLAGAHRGRTSAQPSPRGAPARSSGGGLLLIILVIGAIVAVAILVSRRRRLGSRPGAPWMGSSMAAGPPPPTAYPDYGPSHRPGMSPGAAGAIGAVGGGLLGYELGKMRGEEQQFHRDEMQDDRYRGGPYDSADQVDRAGQGDWVVGQDSDFGDGNPGSGSGGAGDW
ncbi:MAG: hypothetical protein ACRDRI_15990 [Pseudonocardiaceae bacterium]